MPRQCKYTDKVSLQQYPLAMIAKTTEYKYVAEFLKQVYHQGIYITVTIEGFLHLSFLTYPKGRFLFIY